MQDGENRIEKPGRRTQAIIVAGMHRSGTSAVARILSLLGASLPRTLMPQQRDNELGFWESDRITRLHDELLESGGSAWDDVLPMPADWFGSPAAQAFEDRLLDLLDEEFGEASPFVLKDPRISRLVPLWSSVLDRFGAEPAYVLPVRNPLEVAASLEARNGFDPQKSLVLWLTHVLGAERDTRDRPRAFVLHHELLGDWRAAVERLSADLSIGWPGAPGNVELEVEAFLDPRRQHHAVDPSRLASSPEVPRLVADAFDALLAPAHEDEERRRSFDRIRRDFEGAAEILGGAVAAAGRSAARVEQELAALSSESARREAALDARTADVERLRADLREARRGLAERDTELSRLREAAATTRQFRAVAELRRRAKAASQLASWLRRPTRARLRLLRDYIALRRTGRFDRGFYLAENRDVARAGVDPLMHFVEHGWRTGLDPSPDFSTSGYLEARPDVARAGVNPLVHAMRYPDPEVAGASAADPPAEAKGAVASVAEGTNGISELILARSKPGESILVWSSGETPPPRIESRQARPFPQRTGQPSPRDTALIAQLEVQRSEGARLLVFPEGASPAVRKLPAFARHLRSRYHEHAGDNGGGATAFDLAGGRASSLPWAAQLEDLLVEYRSRLAGDPSILDVDGSRDLAAALPIETIFRPPREARDRLPYLDSSVDIVVVRPGGDSERAEARRVARSLVVTAREARSGRAFDAEWLRERELPQPRVSVVIPTYNAAEHLDRCLGALEETIPRGYEVEVLIVDDASTDGTGDVIARRSARDARVRSLRHEANAGYLDSCNLGAAEARGELLVFLNNDTIPLPGWLPALVRTFVADPDAGAVGGKLLYSDGRLQEAGGVVFSDASAANFGRNSDDPEAPLHSFLREVDYCSGALLAVPRDLFVQLGGFDIRYRPMYYEDTDLCFSVRAAGRRVLYQPESVVVHLEGASAGTDPAQGMKRHQALNREKFAARWARALERQPRRPERLTPDVWHKLAFSGCRPAEPVAGALVESA